MQEGAPYNIYNNPVDREAAKFFSDVNVIHGVVQDFATDTPFGRFLTPGLADRADVEIIIRPQHLKMDFDRNGSGPLPTPPDGVPARGRVARARFVGNQSIVELAMDHDGSVLKATIPGVFLPQGRHAALAVAAPRPLLRLSLPGAERAHEPVFAAEQSPRRAAVWGLRAPAGRHISGRGPAACRRSGKGDDDMLNNIGPAGLLLIAIVVLVLFGRGKVAGLMGEVGKGITSFKRGINEGKAEIENASRRGERPRHHAREGKSLIRHV